MFCVRTNWNWRTFFFYSSLLALFLFICIHMQTSVDRDRLKHPIATQTVMFQVANQTVLLYDQDTKVAVTLAGYIDSITGQ